MTRALLVPPGGTIGILGGGQLGRMLALAAARLGIKAHVYSPPGDVPAAQVAAAATIARYDDAEALAAFARAVDVVTFEFENIPPDALHALTEFVPVRPGADALRVTQDRLMEKTLVRQIGFETAPFAPVSAPADLAPAIAALGTPAILKTRRFGYDGKGQARVDTQAQSESAWQAIGASPAILEGFVRFELEISVVAARSADGRTACYDPVENVHRDHILHTSRVPARIADGTAASARQIAEQILRALDYVGVLAVELFVVHSGRLLVNEIAPRVHNSGHWTIDGCTVSQFEQHVRAVCGWPLGSPARHSDVKMTNLIGAEIDDWPKLAAEPGLALHLYGKAETRPGRKMGHVTRIYPVGSFQGSSMEWAGGQDPAVRSTAAGTAPAGTAAAAPPRDGRSG